MVLGTASYSHPAPICYENTSPFEIGRTRLFQRHSIIPFSTPPPSKHTNIHQHTRKAQNAGLALTNSCSKYAWNQDPASGAGLRALALPQLPSYLTELVSDVPSDSAPGLTQTKASTRASPVSEVGLVPNPVPTALHLVLVRRCVTSAVGTYQWPCSIWPVGCFPLRPWSTM